MRDIVSKDYKITIIGLGYVGLPLAIEFNKKYNVIGYDLDASRISELKNNFDRTNELTGQDLIQLKTLEVTNSESKIANSNVYIITVPTPVDKNNKPNLMPIVSATEMVGGYLKPDDIVIYESTVFPGCTDQICVPILENFSNLKFNVDFFCGYSPERINPGDKDNTLTKITKVVSASNSKTLEEVNKLYKSIISAGTYKAKSIVVAEAAKVIENTQRDVNIALINELALIFDKLNINTQEVLDAASTKWNFLPFKPGLVGGHCIGVDPYYLTHKALEVGYHPEIILAGRRINDNMGNFIADKTISQLTHYGINPLKAKISILGLSFKENCPDLRNTKVITIIERLKHYNCQINVTDCWVDYDEAHSVYGVTLKNIEEITNQSAIIIAVPHEEYLDLKKEDWKRMVKPGGIAIDIKSILDQNYFNSIDINYWSL